MPRNAPTVEEIGTGVHQTDTLRGIGAGFLIWFTSGTPVQVLFPGQEFWLVLALTLQAIVCLPRRYHNWNQATLLLAAMTGFVVWTIIASASSLDGQFLGLLGQLIKITIIALPVVFLSDLRIGLFRSMSVICALSLTIFFSRQIFLLFGVDIADLFSKLFEFMNLPEDRTIIFFNFDKMEEASRNAGPFREPGMYAANIVLSLLLGASLRSYPVNFSLKRAVFLQILALITTQSTMGLVAIPFVIYLFIPLYIIQKIHQRIAIIIIAAICAALIFVFGSTQIDKVQNQYELVVNEGNRWYSTRFGNASMDLDAVVSRPIVGHGFSEDDRPTLSSLGIDVREWGLGNGLTGTMVKHGVVLSVFLYILFLKGCLGLFTDRRKAFTCWISIGVILFSQQLILLPAIFTILGKYDRSLWQPRRKTMKLQMIGNTFFEESTS